jgi:CTP:molybdopterin cytidylyltransferase MocA
MESSGVIILAGGNSSRFGKPKPFLKLDSGLTFTEHLIVTYQQFGCKEIILVLNSNLSEVFENSFPETVKGKIKIVYNSKPDLGRFYSLKLGADAVSDSDYFFIQNIDNPFTDLVILQKLYSNRKPYAFVSPFYTDRGGHPVLVPGIIIDMIRKEANIDLSLKEFLTQFKKIPVSIENDKILVNINTPDNYFEMFPAKN